MNTKLTLTLDKKIIDEAKKYASDKGKSLSEMVANYFKHLVEADKLAEENISPRVQKLKGILKVDENFDYRKVLAEEKDRKHA